MSLAAAPPAAADPVNRCTATRGAIVAVDFGPFGGGVARGCDTTPTTGYELLREAGFTTAGTGHDGPAFICRIGHGSFDSGRQYPTPATEDCVLTPQATAYWSYWVASRDASEWSYSHHGAMDRRPKPGDVDAWVYGGTDVGGSTGKPDFSPDEVRAEGLPPAPDPEAPAVPPGEVNIAKAASWVRGKLTRGDRVVDDGGETPNHLLTTEAAYALAAADGRSRTVDRIAAFLGSRATAYAYPEGTDAAPDAAAAARLALVATSTEKDPRDVGGHDLLTGLADHVCPTGSDSGVHVPGCTARGDFRNATYTEAQALALLALLRGGERPPAHAVTRLTRAQCRSGGFAASLGHTVCDGDLLSTGAAVLALRKAGGHPGQLGKARTYLRKSQFPSGAFPGWTGSTTGHVISTAYAAQALRALGDTVRADAAVSWLSRQQLPDGGFGFDEDATDASVYATSVAVLAGKDTSLARLTTEPRPAKPPTGPPTEPPAGDGEGPDLKKGVAYLTGAANLRQGRFYGTGGAPARADFGLTIDGAYALAATGLDNGKLRGVVDFLDGGGEDGEGRTVHDWTKLGTAYAGGGYIGKTAVLAQAVGRDPRDFAGEDLIAGLAKAVCARPSAAPDRSCPARGAYTWAPSVFAQSLAVIAQLRAGEKSAAAAPVAYLVSLQHSSGAWPSLVPSTGDSDVDSTAIAAMALDLVGEPGTDRAVDRALAWIATRQFADGGFPGAAGNSVNSAALAVQGLSLDAPRYGKQIAKARKFLAARQNGDGGFNVAKEGQRGSDLRASTQAVGGSTGVSFGTLTRDLSGTSPQPAPAPTPSPSPSSSSSSTPDIVTDGTDGADGTAGTDTGGDRAHGSGGELASTGVPAASLAAGSAALVLTGLALTAVFRDRRRTREGSPS
ncbi:prenyltransferase/squalene oxidase repeat-containing protein [Streptomyces sp. NPDC001985]|uniref:prenyltransferase/squalene oxidase repeat-containing protein n=1 Tax=Streptomyces sp. NPDC001985 TaxID=3154406 RepID=UPI00332BAF2B